MVASIIKQTNKKSGVTYVYRQESYWVPELKQPRSHRRLIGKIDPISGKVVPTGKSGRRKKTAADTPGGEAPSGQDDLKAELLKCTKEKQALEHEVADLKAQVRQLVIIIRKIKGNLEGLQTTMSRNIDRCVADCRESIPED